MAKLTIAGTVIEGVQQATVRIVHLDPKSPDLVPVMEWDIILRNQHSDLIPKWALEPQGAGRFKRCELVVHHHQKKVAHTWTLLNGYLHEYNEIENPGESGPGHVGNYYMHIKIRGHMLEAKDYTGSNIMQVAAGEESTVADG